MVEHDDPLKSLGTIVSRNFHRSNYAGGPHAPLGFMASTDELAAFVGHNLSTTNAANPPNASADT